MLHVLKILAARRLKIAVEISTVKLSGPGSEPWAVRDGRGCWSNEAGVIDEVVAQRGQGTWLRVHSEPRLKPALEPRPPDPRPGLFPRCSLFTMRWA